MSAALQQLFDARQVILDAYESADADEKGRVDEGHEAKVDRLFGAANAVEEAIMAEPARSVGDLLIQAQVFDRYEPNRGFEYPTEYVTTVIASIRALFGSDASPNPAPVDPIFAAIEAHRAAMQKMEDASGDDEAKAAHKVLTAAWYGLKPVTPTTLQGLIALILNTKAYLEHLEIWRADPQEEYEQDLHLIVEAAERMANAGRGSVLADAALTSLETALTSSPADRVLDKMLAALKAALPELEAETENRERAIDLGSDYVASIRGARDQVRDAIAFAERMDRQ